jgi:hypothetical protein
LNFTVKYGVNIIKGVFALTKMVTRFNPGIRDVPAKMNDGPIESSGEVLLAHASLYVLAESWGVNSLKMLVLSKLYQTLSTLHLDASKVQEIIDLV